jgi:hypothetical protein
VNFDPNVVGTEVTVEVLISNGPSGKRYGFSLKASF